MRSIGIHFGEHNLVMAGARDGRPCVIPSREGEESTPAVVAIGPGGELLTGKAARERAAADPASAISGLRGRLARQERVSLAGRSFTPIELAGVLLCKQREDAESLFGEPVRSAVLTVPGIYPAEGAAGLEAAARLAGLSVLQLIPEPFAACLAHRSAFAARETVLVYHLTSAGVAVSVLLHEDGAIRLLAHADSSVLSGDAMTDAMLELLIKVIGSIPLGDSDEEEAAVRASLRRVAEDAKIHFGTAGLGAGMSTSTDPDSGYLGSVSADQYEARIRPMVDESTALARKVIGQAGLTTEAIDRVIPVGAATNTLLVRRALAGLSRREKLLTSLDPRHCLALGAAAHASFLVEEAARPVWHARLRAALEHRVRDLETPTQQAAPTAPESVAICSQEGCQAPATGRCHVCGRLFCDQHGSDGRCARCLAALTAAMAACYEQAGRPDEAATVLEGLAVHPARYHLGRIRALEGQLESALAELQAALTASPADDDARRATARVLSARAAQHAATGEHVAAADDLRRALELDPGLPGVRRYLAILENLNAFAYIDRGEPDRAVAAWEEEQLRSPESYRLAHNLAILYYRLACEREEAGDPAADEAWRKAIAHWALVAHTPAFWEEWLAERAACVGDIPESAAEELQRHLLSSLRSDLQEYYSRYTQAGRPADAARHREYQLLHALECRAAAVLRAVLEAAGDERAGQGVPCCCGPLMLGYLERSPQGRQVVSGIRAFCARVRAADGSEALRAAVHAALAAQRDAQPPDVYLFSPLGRIHVLLEESWVDQAIAELQQVLAAEPGNREATSLIVAALTRKGDDLIGAEQYNDALAVLERALGYGRDADAVRRLISTACTRRAHQLLQEKQVDQAIAVLQRGLRLAPQDADIKSNLCACYCEQGRLLNNDNKYEEAIKVLEQAVQLDSQSAQARHFLQVALLNRAGQIASGSSYRRYDQALRLAERAMELGDLSPEHRRFVAHLYNQRGVERWNSGDRFAARGDFEKAFRLNPADPVIRQNLINAGGVPSLDGATLEEILRLLQQKRG